MAHSQPGSIDRSHVDGSAPPVDRDALANRLVPRSTQDQSNSAVNDSRQIGSQCKHLRGLRDGRGATETCIRIRQDQVGVERKVAITLHRCAHRCSADRDLIKQAPSGATIKRQEQIDQCGSRCRRTLRCNFQDACTSSDASNQCGDRTSTINGGIGSRKVSTTDARCRNKSG